MERKGKVRDVRGMNGQEVREKRKNERGRDLVRQDEKESVGSEIRIGRNLIGSEGNRKKGKGKLGEIEV